MKEKTLLRIAFICSILGILLMYMISGRIDYDESGISDIGITDVGEKIKLKGVVTGFLQTENAAFIELTQPSEITVIVFEDISLGEGDYIEVIGEVEEYKEELEIVGKRIRILDSG